MMDDPGKFTPTTQRELSAALDATRRTISEARENMRIIDEGRSRAERRIRELELELAEERRKSGKAAASEKALKGELDAQKEESDRQKAKFDRQEAEHARVASSLAAAKEEAADLGSQLSDLSAEHDVLARKANDIDDILSDKMDLEREVTEAAASMSAQEEVLGSLQEKLENARSEAAASQQVVDAARAEADDLSGQLVRAGDAARTLEKQRAEQDGVLAQRDEALAELGDELAQTKASGEELDGALAGMSNKVNDLEAQLGSADEQRRAVQDQLDQGAESRKTLEEALCKAQEALVQCSQEKDGVKRELSEMRGAIEGQNAQRAAEAELQNALQLDLELSRRAVDELKQALAETDREFTHDTSSPE